MICIKFNSRLTTYRIGSVKLKLKAHCLSNRQRPSLHPFANAEILIIEGTCFLSVKILQRPQFSCDNFLSNCVLPFRLFDSLSSSITRLTSINFDFYLESMISQFYIKITAFSGFDFSCKH